MTELIGPAYHYYRAPYSILSFIAGLYCDAEWSRKEFEKWLAAGYVDGKYAYNLFLEPYPGLIGTSLETLLNDKVPEENEDDADANGRRAPNRGNCEEIWPALLAELQKPAEPRGDGRLPLFYDKKPVISTLAAIYLSDDKGADSAVSYWVKADKKLLSLFSRLRNGKVTPATQSVLLELKDALFADLMDPPNCW